MEAIDKLGHNKSILLADLSVFTLLSFIVATQLYSVPLQNYFSQLFPALLIVAVSLYLLSAFEITLNTSLASLLSRNILSVLIAISILLVIIYLLGPGSGRNVYGRGILFSTTFAFGIYLLSTRYFLFKYLRRRKPFHQWVFVGAEAEYKEVKAQADVLHRHKLEHRPDSWLDQNLGVDNEIGIILQDEIYANEELANRLINAKFNGIRIISVEQFCETYLEKIPLFHIQNRWFISGAGFGYINDSIRQRVKRTIDLVVVILTLPITLVLLAISIFLIVVIDRQNPIYSQQRVGQHGRIFRLFKLRTMRANGQTPNAEWTEKNDIRVTELGKYLRRYRLDEILQLGNVLRGEMSIIGPRPEQPSYTELLEQQIPYYDIRHSVKPGITGWAQVKFPYGASIADSREKLEYDLYYIKNYSLLLDMTIYIKTLYTIVSGSGR